MKINITGVIDPFWNEGEYKQIIENIQNASPDEHIEVFINSPGGEVFTGFAIANMLKMHKGEVSTVVTGQASSIAGIIFLAGDKRKAFKNSQIMFHRASTMAVGNALELREVAEDLQGIDNLLIDNVTEISGFERDDIVAKMDKEWFIYGGKDMKNLGFVDEIIDEEAEEKKDNKEKQPVFNYKGYKTLKKYLNIRSQSMTDEEIKDLQEQLEALKKENEELKEKLKEEEEVEEEEEMEDVEEEEEEEEEEEMEDDSKRILDLLEISGVEISKDLREAIKNKVDARDHALNILKNSKPVKGKKKSNIGSVPSENKPQGEDLDSKAKKNLEFIKNIVRRK